MFAFGNIRATEGYMTDPIRWYSMNKELQAREHKEVNLQEAMQIVDDYFATAGKKYDSDDEAVAAAMFGFFHSKTELHRILHQRSQADRLPV